MKPPETPTGTDPEYRLGKTPRGQRLHLVDVASKSALAMGTDGTTDFAAICGQVPERWSFDHDIPDDQPPADEAIQTCSKCALTAYRTGLYANVDLPVSDEAIRRASDIQQTDHDPDVDVVE